MRNDPLSSELSQPNYATDDQPLPMNRDGRHPEVCDATADVRGGLPLQKQLTVRLPRWSDKPNLEGR
jgi:hypothetical protein